MLNNHELSQAADKPSPKDLHSLRIQFARISQDVPELLIDGLTISDAERDSLLCELKERYPVLLANVKNGRHQFRFRTPIGGIPPDTEFRGTLLSDKVNARVDGLLFTPANAPECLTTKAEQVGRATPATLDHWSVAFLAETATFLNSERLRLLKDRYQSHSLAACLEEIETLQHSQPDTFGLILLAGYLSLGESLARRHDPDRASLYLFAGRGLEELLDGSPEFGNRSERKLDETTGLRELIPRACRCLARLFGFAEKGRQD